MENHDQFVERGVDAVKAELAKEPFRGTPHFADLMAAVRGVLRHISDTAGADAHAVAAAFHKKVEAAPFAPVAPDLAPSPSTIESDDQTNA